MNKKKVPAIVTMYLSSPTGLGVRHSKGWIGKQNPVKSILMSMLLLSHELEGEPGCEIN